MTSSFAADISLEASHEFEDGITGEDIWRRHGSNLYVSQRFSGSPGFYPVYRWEDYYSYSPLPLLLKKGEFSVSDRFFRDFDSFQDEVCRPNPLADADIERLGGPRALERRYTREADLIEALAASMNADVAAAEADNPDTTNYVLCGGKDSLNLLLLDWKNPVIALSAQPNFPLVRSFVEENGLSIEVRELEDRQNDSLTGREVAESFCMVDLKNWKWTDHLSEIASRHDRRVIFWKGQVADLYFTDYWRSYTHRRSKAVKLMKRAYRKAAPYMPSTLDRFIADRSRNDLALSIWNRAAVMQGAHLGFLRSICGALFLSAYHGPRTFDVVSAIDFHPAITRDIRPLVGNLLAGKEVRYPSSNPSPSGFDTRSALRSRQNFTEALANMGVTIP